MNRVNKFYYKQIRTLLSHFLMLRLMVASSIMPHEENNNSNITKIGSIDYNVYVMIDVKYCICNGLSGDKTLT